MSEEINVQIEGMHCASCVSRVEKALLQLDGVSDAQVNLVSQRAKLFLDSSRVTADSIKKAVEDAGYKAHLTKEDKKTLANFSITGMHCASCSTTIEKNVGKMDGIGSVKVMLSTNSAQIDYDPSKVTIDDVKKKIADLGYSAELKEERFTSDHFDENKQLKDMRLRFWISFALSLPVFIFGMGHMAPFNIWFEGFAHWLMTFEIFPGMLLNYLVQFLFTTPIQFFLAYPFYKAAWKSLKNKSASMDVLVVLGTTAAYTYSLASMFYPYIQPEYDQPVFFEVTAVLMTFIFLGKYLEEVTKGRTSEAIKKLIELRPKTATVIRDGKEIEIPIDDVIIDDVLVVKPGASVPVDGLVIDGQSYVDESMISGEPMAVFKEKGDEVIGGTINENGLLKVEAKKVGENTTLNQIITMVENAQTSKLPIQQVADKISAVFVPIVVGLALTTSLIWFILFSTGVVSTALLPSGVNIFLFALLVGISVLVISCPCALGLATPTAIMVGTGLGAQNGILVRTGESLETAKNLDVILLDKTGTITVGKPKLDAIHLLDESFTKNNILSLAGSLEQGSEHSIAKAILSAVEEKDIELMNIGDFNAIPGKGVKASIDGEAYLLGNRKLLDEYTIDLSSSMEETMKEFEEKGKTTMVLVKSVTPIAIIAISDVIKDKSVEAIKALKDMGLIIGMVSGDNQRAANYIASQIGIEEIHAEVLPDEKLDIVLAYQQKGLKVGFVGDGINDAPALAQADIGIAIGSGTDIAIETGDIVLIKDDLRDVATAIDLSEKIIRKVRMGLFWALFYNSLAIPIAAGALFIPFGFLLPAELAGLAMAMSSVSVVLNSLTLKWYKTPFEKKDNTF